jgi:hypothetical protein
MLSAPTERGDYTGLDSSGVCESKAKGVVGGGWAFPAHSFTGDTRSPGSVGGR